MPRGFRFLVLPVALLGLLGTLNAYRPAGANSDVGAAKSRPPTGLRGCGAGKLSSLCPSHIGVDATAARASGLTSSERIPADRDLFGSGFIADGRSHPLSSVRSFNHRLSAGWTLARWQIVLPAARGLTDEIDWAATQSLIDAATGPIAVRFPSATRALLNRPLVVCRHSVSFFGSGSTAGRPSDATLTFTGGTDGIRHCANGGTKVELHDLAMASAVAKGNIFALNDLAAQYTRVDNVLIRGFNNCGQLINPGGTIVSKLFCYNSQAAGTEGIGNGLLYKGSNAFVNHIDNSLMQGYVVGYDFDSTNNIVATPGQLGLEDVQVTNSAVGGGKIAIRIHADNPGYGPFFYSFTNMSVDVTTQFIDAGSCNAVTVSGGNWLQDVPPTVANTTWTGDRNLIDIGGNNGCHSFHMRDMWFFDNAEVTSNSLITAEAGASDVKFRDNHVETNHVTMSTGYLQLAPATGNISESGTDWSKFFATIAPPANAVRLNGNIEPSNRLESTRRGVPNLSGCGKNPALQPGSDNVEGVIIEGSGNVAGCTVGFAKPYRSISFPVVLSDVQGLVPPTVTALSPSGFSYMHAVGRRTISYRTRAY